MRKQEAIRLFGTVSELAAALECSRQAIYLWREVLPQSLEDRVIGACIRLGIDRPPPNPDPPSDQISV